MKRLTLLDEDGANVAEVDTGNHANANYEVDVPPHLTLVGVYGNFGGGGQNQAIWGFGLMFFERAPEPEDPDLMALRLKIERL